MLRATQPNQMVRETGSQMVRATQPNQMIRETGSQMISVRQADQMARGIALQPAPLDESDRMPLEIAAQIIEKRQNRYVGQQPEGARYITVDYMTGCTSTDLFMLQWEKDQILTELIGDVVYAHRGPTAKNAWDRGDVQLEIGRPGEKEKVCVFAWKHNASRLEGAKINTRVKLCNLVVVPETGARHLWSGSVDIKLRFVSASTLEILDNGNFEQDQNIETGPSTSAAAAAAVASVLSNQIGAGASVENQNDAIDDVG
uniref:Uncharacterized protein n=1 Tax=Meloidogyne incognita TaxID=6306 RepID=A0A914NQB4_MELIC